MAQIELARLLGGTERNIFAVGDPDQAIFRFRGASSAAFAEFQRCFPGAGSVVLDENQRSTSNILRCAYAIIQRNPAVDCRLPGGAEFKRQALRSARQARAAAEGKPLAPQKLGIVLHQGKEQEAADLAACIEELRSAGYAGSIAVVYRMHSHRDEIARALADREIPFVVKGLDILETAVIRDLLACLGAVASLSDSEALFRVAALPMFGMEGDAVRSSLASSSREASFTSLLQKIPGGARVLAAVERARAFAASVDWNSAQVCAFVIRSFGFAESEVAVRVFREFVDKWHAKPITVSGSLQEFIEYVDLFHEAGGALELPVPETPGAVQIMTVHTAKGLEFNSVFVLRANSGSFPSHYREAVFEFPPELRAMPLTDDSKEIHTQEERRLFYVALTPRPRFAQRLRAPGDREGRHARRTAARDDEECLRQGLLVATRRALVQRPHPGRRNRNRRRRLLAAHEAAPRDPHRHAERHLHRRLRYLPAEVQVDARLAHSRPGIRRHALRQDHARRAARPSSGNSRRSPAQPRRDTAMFPRPDSRRRVR